MKRSAKGDEEYSVVVVLSAIVSDIVGSTHKKTSSVLTTVRGFDRLSMKKSESGYFPLNGCNRFFVLIFPLTLPA